jgi:Mn2+/Fe2+ NRAMP family transporter
VAAAPFLVVVMLISGNRTLMGRYHNHRLATVLGWATVALMTAAAIAMLLILVLP